ncbi:MAG: UbiD family decarboxylase, partial [Alphaproteobacteria bacterium]
MARTGTSRWAPSPTCSRKRAAAARRRCCSTVSPAGRCRAHLSRPHAGPQAVAAALRERRPRARERGRRRRRRRAEVSRAATPRAGQGALHRYRRLRDDADPDSGWFNLGAYRSQVYDGKTVGCQITEGKHGRIHRDKYFERGQPMKVVILCGQDPLLFMLSSSPLPEIGEMDLAGGLRGEPVDVVRGPYTGFPIPADCEIAIEGETVPGEVRPEGPFGEWMGYYSDDTQERPCVNVKTILHRHDPILTCAPQHKPVDETGLLKGIAGAAQIWRALDACGVPEVLGVWNHEAGPATRFTAIQIRQRYPGHARQALHI